MRLMYVSILAVLLTLAAPADAAKQKRSGSTTGASSCPCSGTRLCVGPRGGKFCRAPSGAKRYQR